MDDAAAIAGISRGRLGLRSAATAFAAGEVPRAVHLLRRTWLALAEPRADLTAGDDDPELRSQIGERLAFFLLETEDSDASAEALRVAARPYGRLRPSRRPGTWPARWRPTRWR